jgi:hypothetical protein
VTLGGEPALGRAQGVVDRVGDGPGVVGHAPTQRLRPGHREQCRHLVEVLDEEPVAAPAGDQVQAVAHVEQPRVGGPHRRPPRVGDLGVGDAAQHPDVAQPAAGLLDVAVEQEGEFAVMTPAPGGQLAQHGQVGAGPLAPLVQRHLAQPGGQVGVAGDVAGVDQAEAGLGVLGGDREGLVNGPDRVVEGQTGVPDRVPDALGHLGHVRGPVVHEHEVDVRVRSALAPSQPAQRDQADPGPAGPSRQIGQAGGRLREQAGEPGVERRRPCVAGGATHAGWDRRR